MKGSPVGGSIGVGIYVCAKEVLDGWLCRVAV